jgi:hypothetical protein
LGQWGSRTSCWTIGEIAKQKRRNDKRLNDPYEVHEVVRQRRRPSTLNSA